ncbi:helix-turn-helix transcriptional regulator [Agrobacterium rhizogenes]|uniref:helix-turn-helix transcriptional regulator n=1 Tax=Rhizobium rhizogenes TaxID=359 RepID=UPI0022B680C8|nr:helix-turn-helix transcriptional regulator [Rhizobium rhizogenes]MCZ7450797.1 helix-turn-helix transcriptional regulator [Rhizobium rhizogenes]
MPENKLTDFNPQFKGETFEDMVDALTAGFGHFEASRTDRQQLLDWKVGFWGNEQLSLVSNQDLGGWGARTVGETPECLAILLPRMGALDVKLGNTTVAGMKGRLLVMNNREPESVSVNSGFHRSDTVSLSWKTISQTFAAMVDTPLVGGMDLSPVADLSSGTGQLIGSLVETIILGMRNDGPLLRSPIAMANLTQALADIVIRLLPHRHSYLLDNKVHLLSPRHVNRAIEFMHLNIGQPITMRNVAEAAGTSLRALEVSFRDFKQMTPSGYLRKIRLQAARSDLLNPLNQLSLRDISLKWGFLHFGRFSATYRAGYGENPSDTKRRSRIST